MPKLPVKHINKSQMHTCRWNTGAFLGVRVYVLVGGFFLEVGGFGG